MLTRESLKKRLGRLAFVGAMLQGSCGSDSALSQADACNQKVSTICDKVFACFTPDQLAQGQSDIGVNPTECKGKLATYCKQVCAAGETYHADQDALCLAAVKQVSCTDILAGAVTRTIPTPAVCDQVCSTAQP